MYGRAPPPPGPEYNLVPARGRYAVEPRDITNLYTKNYALDIT